MFLTQKFTVAYSFLEMAKDTAFNIKIDKLTRSIENAITGDNFKTLPWICVI